MPRFPVFIQGKPLRAPRNAVARTPRPFGHAPASASGMPCGDTAMVVARLQAWIRSAYGYLRPTRQIVVLPEGEPCDGRDTDAWVRYVREIARLVVSPPPPGEWFFPQGRRRRRRGEVFSPSDLPSPVGAPAQPARVVLVSRTTLDLEPAASVDVVVASGQVRIRGPPTATTPAPVSRSRHGCPIRHVGQAPDEHARSRATE